MNHRLRNRKTSEFLGVRETVHTLTSNSGEFAGIGSQAGLNSYTLKQLEEGDR
jgi:hypothetical protein